MCEKPPLPTAGSTGELCVVGCGDSATGATLAYLLQKQGFRVTTTSCGECACKLAHHPQTRLLALDMTLAEPDAYTLCRELRLRDRPSSAELTIWLISARDSMADRAVLDELRIDCRIPMPIDPDRISDLARQFRSRTDQAAA